MLLLVSTTTSGLVPPAAVVVDRAATELVGAGRLMLAIDKTSSRDTWAKLPLEAQLQLEARFGFGSVYLRQNVGEM